MLPTICACTRLRRAARWVNEHYDVALAPAGLTTPQFSLLRMMARTGRCSLTEFGAATGHDRTTLNRTLGPLERAGYIRSDSGADRRCRMVSLTDQGVAAIDRAAPLWQAAQDKMADHLGDDMPRLFELLDRMERAA